MVGIPERKSGQENLPPGEITKIMLKKITGIVNKKEERK